MNHSLKRINAMLLMVSLGVSMLSSSAARAEFGDLDLRLPPEAIRGDAPSFTPTGRPVFAPFELGQSDLTKITIATGAAIILFANDKEVTDFTRRHNGQVLDEVYGAGASFVNKFIPAYLGGGYLLGVVTDNQELKKYVLIGMESVAAATMVTTAIKLLATRQRPAAHYDPRDFEASTRNPSELSLPSGHSTAAFAFATFLAETHQGPQERWIPILAYTAATATSIERVHDLHHWPSDVVLGALIGHLVAKNVVHAKMIERGFLITPGYDAYGNFQLQMIYTGRLAPSRPCPRNAEGKVNVEACIAAAAGGVAEPPVPAYY